MHGDVQPAELPFERERAVPEAPPRRKPRHYGRRDAIMDSTLAQSEKDVLHVILRHMGFNRGEERAASPGEERMALMASVCVRTVRTTIASLEAKRVIKVERRPMHASRYTIVWARLAELADPRLAPGFKRPGRGRAT